MSHSYGVKCGKHQEILETDCCPERGCTSHGFTLIACDIRCPQYEYTAVQPKQETSMRFTIGQQEYAATLLNGHSKHVEAHWKLTLETIAAELCMSDEEVQELINTNNVRDMWNQ